MIVRAHSPREKTQGIPRPHISTMSFVTLHHPVHEPDQHGRIVDPRDEAQELETEGAGQRAREDVLDGVHVVGGEGDGLAVLVVGLVDPVQGGVVEQAVGQVEEEVLHDQEEEELPHELEMGWPSL